LNLRACYIRVHIAAFGNSEKERTMSSEKRGLGLWLVTVVAVVFGVLTIKSGGSVLFLEGEARAAAGNYVGFVVWFNFLAGFAYIVAGVGLFQRARWAPNLAVGIAVLTLLVFAAFGVHVLNGGAFEQRTVAAMSIRSVLWLGIAVFAYRSLRRGPTMQNA
jgi:fatty acid desaturase